MELENRTPQNVERIVLIGFMGAGKSTVGPLIAKQLGWSFHDADQEIESETGVSVAHLFAKFGEPIFRQMEARVVARLCSVPSAVIALGGGAVETEASRSLFIGASSTYSVFLQAPLEVLIRRCEQQANAAERPVLRQRETLRQRFQARLPYYQSAHLTLDTDGLSAEAVAAIILRTMPANSYVLPLHQKAITH